MEDTRQDIIQETGLVLDYKEMPAYKGAKDRQIALLEHYQFVQITDNATYELAKKHRTALRQGRYELQNGEKAIASKLNDFRQMVKVETENLIKITIDAETKQQTEIDNFEEQKQKEKEEAIRKERERKEALRAQMFGFRDSKNSAIETATLKTIEAIIEDIETAALQVEEFTEDFHLIKEKLIDDAKKKQAQLVEDERLKAERKAQEAERQRLADERAAFEKQKKEQEDELRKEREKESARINAEREAEAAKLKQEREAEQLKLKAEREAEEAALKAEREKIEAEKAQLAKEEAERKTKAEAELKERMEAEKAQRIQKVIALGFDFNNVTNEFTFGSQIIELSEFAEISETAFENLKLPTFKVIIEEEKQRIEAIKPDKQKLTEMISYFDLSGLDGKQLATKQANNLLSEFVTKLNALVSEYKQLINEL